jgi:hypothetical protein
MPDEMEPLDAEPVEHASSVSIRNNIEMAIRARSCDQRD